MIYSIQNIFSPVTEDGTVAQLVDKDATIGQIDLNQNRIAFGIDGKIPRDESGGGQ